MQFLRYLPGVGLALVIATGAGAQSTTMTGLSRDSNSAISVNTLLLGRVADRTTDAGYNGIDIQEAELQISSIVDPYWRADLVFAVHPAHDHIDEHAAYEGDVEVAVVNATALPWGFGVRIGKDYLPFGKHAPLHSHQRPFVDAPLAVQTFLGDHGLTDVGVQVAHDLPLPWYADLEAYEDEAVAGGDVQVWGADVAFKWVSAATSRGPAFNLVGEVILPRPDGRHGDPSGWFVFGQYRFARNWWLGAGLGAIDKDVAHDDDGEDHEHGELFGWVEAIGSRGR